MAFAQLQPSCLCIAVASLAVLLSELREESTWTCFGIMFFGMSPAHVRAATWANIRGVFPQEQPTYFMHDTDVPRHVSRILLWYL